MKLADRPCVLVQRAEAWDSLSIGWTMNGSRSCPLCTPVPGTLWARTDSGLTLGRFLVVDTVREERNYNDRERRQSRHDVEQADDAVGRHSGGEEDEHGV